MVAGARTSALASNSVARVAKRPPAPKAPITCYSESNLDMMDFREKPIAPGGPMTEIDRLREELRAERARRENLERSHESLQAAFEKLEGGVVLIDTDRVLFANPA